MDGKHEFCFIACVNNDLLMNECIRYIDRLYVPDGWTVDVITVREAHSMAEGYNAAMNESDAAIKICLHIINRHNDANLFLIMPIFCPTILIFHK